MKLLAIAFFSFLCFILYQADTGQHNALFELKNQIPHGDKVGHLLMYGTLCLLANCALNFRFLFNKQFIQIGSLSVLIFSLSEEFSQQLFATRTFSLGDITANLVAVLLATIFSVQLENYTQKKQQVDFI